MGAGESARAHKVLATNHLHAAVVQADADLADAAAHRLDLLEHRFLRIAVGTGEDRHRPAVAARAVHLPADRAVVLGHVEDLAGRLRDERRVQVRLRLGVADHRRAKPCEVPREERVAADDRLLTQRLELVPVPLYEAGSDFYQIEISLLGEEGMPAAEDESVRIQLVGDGELMGIENGSPDDLTPYASNTRRTFMGRAIAYIRARDEVTVYAESESGLRETVKIG